MSWRDREYSREDSRYRGLLWNLATGSVPLGRWFGIRVRVHYSLVLFILFGLLLPPFAREYGYWLALKLAAISGLILFGIVLLHEFGHCVAARLVGGEADDILLWPLGGLATATPPQRPWPTFVTVAGGPLVNVGICALTGLAIAFIDGPRSIPFNPFSPSFAAYGTAAFYLGWVYLISMYLLLFNLLPVYPLDGGKIVQTMLWPKMGYGRSMYISTVVGIVGAIVLGLYGIVTLSLFLVLLAVFGFSECYRMRMRLREGVADGLVIGEGGDFGASLEPDTQPKRRKLTKRQIRKARKIVEREQGEAAQIDDILAKVSAHGLSSLTWRERRVLRRATLRRRERDYEPSRNQGD